MSQVTKGPMQFIQEPEVVGPGARVTFQVRADENGPEGFKVRLSTTGGMFMPKETRTRTVTASDRLAEAELRAPDGGESFTVTAEVTGKAVEKLRPDTLRHVFEVTPRVLILDDGAGGSVSLDLEAALEPIVEAIRPIANAISEPRTVRLDRSDSPPSDDQALWVAIRNRNQAIWFEQYQRFIRQALCRRKGDDLGGLQRPQDQSPVQELFTDLWERDSLLSSHGIEAYAILRTATEIFLLLHCGVGIDESYRPREEVNRLGARRSLSAIQQRLASYLAPSSGRLPYLDTIIDNVFSDEALLPTATLQSTKLCEGLVSDRISNPCLIELLWSYWHEEGMLVQTLNAISLRFQNKSLRPGRDPLAAFALDTLRPLNSLLWGYIEEERHRLSLPRRAYEYDHQYGLRLLGRAVPKLRPADSRSKFLEAFHSLLHATARFYQEDADTTVIAEGYPLLNALKEVHTLLAEGAHNQYGNLAWTARVEMMIQQWLLARPEMREFLRGRAMVPYKEGWMAQVDTMTRLQGWGDTPVTHFRDLGVYGEQILLSIRFGAWVSTDDQAQAKNWARYWKPEIQSYLHAYRAVTGVDLTGEVTQAQRVDATLPAIHLRRRHAARQRA